MQTLKSNQEFAARAVEIARTAALLREQMCGLFEDADEDDRVLERRTVEAMDAADHAAWEIARLYTMRADVDAAKMEGGNHANA